MRVFETDVYLIWGLRMELPREVFSQRNYSFVFHNEKNGYVKLETHRSAYGVYQYKYFHYCYFYIFVRFYFSHHLFICARIDLRINTNDWKKKKDEFKKRVVARKSVGSSFFLPTLSEISFRRKHSRRCINPGGDRLSYISSCRSYGISK